MRHRLGNRAAKDRHIRSNGEMAIAADLVSRRMNERKMQPDRFLPGRQVHPTRFGFATLRI